MPQAMVSYGVDSTPMDYEGVMVETGYQFFANGTHPSESSDKYVEELLNDAKERGRKIKIEYVGIPKGDYIVYVMSREI